MIHDRLVRVVAALFAALASFCVAAQGAGQSAPDFLARSGEVTLTRADWEAEVSRIPPEHRAAFLASPQRVQATVNNLLVNKTLAARARAAGVASSPEVQRRIDNEVDRMLAVVMIDRTDAEARAAFDRDMDRATARARELYLANPKKYVTPDQVDCSHILFSITRHSAAEALAAAEAARAKLEAGADFEKLAREVSEDPSALTNGGRLGYQTPGRLEPEFERVAFAQTKVGEISGIVRTKYGYHLIRHEGRIPSRQRSFDEAKGDILADLRQQAVQRAREDLIGGIRGNPKLEVNQAALDALVVRVDTQAPELPSAPQPAMSKPGG